MARPKKEIIEKSPEKVEKSEMDFSNLPEFVTLIGTEQAKYMKTDKEYIGVHRSIAIKLISNGDATLKKEKN